MSRLPLFPLNTVLFPGQLLPLHIFEPRYTLMVNTCIKKESPFGIVLIREGKEVGEDALPHRVGTTARVVDVERLEEGRMQIVVAGEERFRVLELHRDQPYLTGDVKSWPWPMEMDDIVGLALQTRRVRNFLMRYLAALARAEGNVVEAKDIPTNPVVLACVTAITLLVSPQEKQELLVSPTVAAFLDKEIALLEREVRVLHLTDGVATRLPGRGEIMLSNN
jgi:Lon protease-like protein